MTANFEDEWSVCLERIGAEKDRKAFRDLFDHFAPLLKGFLMKSGNLVAEEAEELVQETMIKVWNKAPSFSASHASASTWIYTIARNTRIDFFRRDSSRESRDFTVDMLYGDRDESTPYASLVHLRNRHNIRKHLNRLPEEQLQVLAMMYFQGKSGKEVADELEIPLGTVKSRIRLALQRMRLGVRPDNEEKEVSA